MDSAEGRTLRPTTSAPTGAIVAQNVPETVPTTRAKNMRTPYVLAKIQMTRQKSPAKKVHVPAMLIRPVASENAPTNGRPRP
ncbi:hypothetical protein BOTCAL_0121g00090 [Botryotinia calthae]|uniref:Uncharacterized protein n=1 Tax=Botryotinia calthae TaxID=38488 RepID=A0A4Y8D4M5_9HELO|nr:hypothetical protein BOTCAL_0121g00090 [Botryotinia calthae]